MKNSLVAFAVGFLFSMGLALSGMTHPQKVIGFLDIFGNWDPSLMFVMAGAVGVHLVVYHLIRHKPTPFLFHEWKLPTLRKVTFKLIIGSFIFGIGWGLAGYCPGPGLVSLANFKIQPVIFVIFMLAGMKIYGYTEKVFTRKI